MGPLCSNWFKQGICWRITSLKPVAHLRKELSKLPREAISSAFSSCMQLRFLEFLASRGREENIYHVWYLRFREAKFSRKLNRTLEETAELIALLGLARPFARLFPQVSDRLTTLTVVAPCCSTRLLMACHKCCNVDMTQIRKMILDVYSLSLVPIFFGTFYIS